MTVELHSDSSLHPQTPFDQNTTDSNFKNTAQVFEHEAKEKHASQYSRSLIEASLDPLVTISPNGTITDVNEASIKITGISREQLIGTDFSNYFTEPEKARQGYLQVFEKGFVADYPLTVKHINGKLTDVLYNASVYKDENGKVLGVFAAARDITSQKQASNYARSLIEASLDPLVTISSSGKITDVNEASIQITGVSREHLIGTDFSYYFTEPEKAQEGYLQVFEDGFVVDYPLTIKHKTGKLFDVLYNASVYKDEKGKVLGVFAAARDVTEQKKASQYARSLIEASLDPLVTINAEGKITDVNEASVRITGVPREKLVGTNFSNYFTEPEKAQKGYHQVFEKGFVSDYPLTIKHTNGKFTDVLYNASVYKDDKGNVLGVFAAARDVTDQKQASLYARSLIEASLDLLVTISSEGKITDVNEASVKVTGVARENLIGTDFSHYFTEPEKAQIGYRQVFEKGFVADYPLTIKHSNGKLTDVLYNASVYKDDKGNVLGVFAAARDVSEQKQASQYSRSLIEASLDPLVTISSEGKITDVNDASVRVTGIQREILIGTDFSSYFTEPEKAQQGYRQVFEKGFVADYPLTIKHKTGKLIDVLYNASVYKNEKGDVLGVFAAARDITQSKNAEEQLRAVNKELEGFSYSVSHDLRAPLRAINGYAKILQEDYAVNLDEDGISSLNAILNNSKKMGELIDGLLAFSRLGKKEVAMTAINMTSLVNSVKEEEMYGNSKEIEFKIDELIPAMGQQILVKQVWVNLISNAIKYSKHNPKICIHIGSYIKENKTIYYVRDNGAGFDMQYYDKLFGVFQRLHSQQEFEGTGIGLAIVQKIITRHGGSVWAESKVNEGACFYFSLPIINN